VSIQSAAAALVESPAYEAAMEQLHEDLFARLMSTPYGNSMGLSLIKAKLEALDELDQQIRAMAAPQQDPNRGNGARAPIAETHA